MHTLVSAYLRLEHMKYAYMLLQGYFLYNLIRAVQNMLSDEYMLYVAHARTRVTTVHGTTYY